MKQSHSICGERENLQNLRICLYHTSYGLKLPHMNQLITQFSEIEKTSHQQNEAREQISKALS